MDNFREMIELIRQMLPKALDCGCGWLMPPDGVELLSEDITVGKYTAGDTIDLAQYGGTYIFCPAHAATQAKGITNDHS